MKTINVDASTGKVAVVAFGADATKPGVLEWQGVVRDRAHFRRVAIYLDALPFAKEQWEGTPFARVVLPSEEADLAIALLRDLMEEPEMDEIEAGLSMANAYPVDLLDDGNEVVEQILRDLRVGEKGEIGQP